MALSRRTRGVLRIVFLVGLAALWVYLGKPGWRVDPPVRGNATVRDADTIEIGQETFRLAGVDALEWTQTCIRDGQTKPWPCGQEAARALARHLRGKNVTCMPQARDRYGRTVAKCDVGGDDIAAWLATNGWAFDSSRFGDRPYLDFEDEAKRARRGAWSGSFIRPWDWRPVSPRPPKANPI